MSASSRASAAAGHVVLANDLVDGDVVYLAADGRWTRRLMEARVSTDGDDAEAMIAAARADGLAVVGPELAALDVDAGPTPRFATLRDAIRAEGPTIEPALQRATGR